MDEPTAPTSSNHPPLEESPPDRQNLITKIILGAVVVLALVVVIVQLDLAKGLFGSDGGQAKNVTPRNPANPANPENPIPLTPQIPVIPPALESAASPTVSQRAMALADRLGNDTTSLIGIVAELSDRLELAEEELKGTRALYTNAARKAGKLEREAATARRKETEIALLRTQLAESRALLDIAERRADALMTKLAASPDPAMLREAQAMRDVFEAELRNTKTRLAQDEVENARLRSDLSAATSELAATETILESTELFIDSIELLPEAAKQLFLELSRLETVERPELESNYRKIEQKLGARVLDTVPFATGSSDVSPSKAATIRGAMAAGKKDSFFLVIGYASKTGNFDLNKELSSARATAVATLAVENSRPGQKVRAVFLGQTDRFSGTNVLDDQICELWEIRK